MLPVLTDRRVKSVVPVKDPVTPSSAAQQLSRDEKKLQRIMQQFQLMEQRAAASPDGIEKQSGQVPLYNPPVNSSLGIVPFPPAAPAVSRPGRKKKIIEKSKSVNVPTFSLPCEFLSTVGYPLTPMHFGRSNYIKLLSARNDPTLLVMQPLKMKFVNQYRIQKQTETNLSFGSANLPNQKDFCATDNSSEIATNGVVDYHSKSIVSQSQLLPIKQEDTFAICQNNRQVIESKHAAYDCDDSMDIDMPSLEEKNMQVQTETASINP